jgi:hypothetical protein
MPTTPPVNPPADTTSPNSGAVPPK